jgi:type II secretory pathway pseudopilin PulG
MPFRTNARQPKTDMHLTELLLYGLLAVVALLAAAIFNHRQRKARERAEQEAERLAFEEFERQQDERRQRIQRLVAQFDDV